MDQPEQPETPIKSTKGYGKRPAWQWIIIYLIVAAIVYSLIYILFIRNGSGY